MGDTIFGLKTANEQIYEKLDGEVENHESTRNSLQNTSASLANAEEKIKQQKLEIRTAETNITRAEARAEELNSQLSREQQYNTTLEGERNELQHQFNQSERGERTATQNDSTSCQKCRDAEARLTALQAKINVLEAASQGSAVESETLKRASENGIACDMASAVREIAHLQGSNEYHKIRLEKLEEDKVALQARIQKMAARLRELESVEVGNRALKRHVLILKDQLDAVVEQLRLGQQGEVGDETVVERNPVLEAQMICFGLLAKHLMEYVDQEDAIDQEHILALLNGAISRTFENSPPRVRLPAPTLYNDFTPQHLIISRSLPLAVEAHSEDILDSEAGLWDEEEEKDKGKGRERGDWCEGGDGGVGGGGGDDSDDDDDDHNDYRGNGRNGNENGDRGGVGGSGGDGRGDKCRENSAVDKNDQQGDGQSENGNGSHSAAQGFNADGRGGDHQNDNKSGNDGGAKRSRNSFQTADGDDDEESNDDDLRDAGAGRDAAPSSQPSIPSGLPPMWKTLRRLYLTHGQSKKSKSLRLLPRCRGECVITAMRL